MTSLITQELVDAFYHDGVVMIPAAISQYWIELLQRGLQRNIDNPSERARVWNKTEAGDLTFYDSQTWQNNPEYSKFILESPMAEIAGRLLNAKSVNFFFDAIFTRTKGAQFRTPFHQDEPYWSISGFDTCSVWMPLVPVEKKSALEFVRGSHRWPERFAQTNFGALTQDSRDQVVYEEEDVTPFPDIEGEREKYDILSWDMQPGDIAVFNARMIHGGSGNLAPERDLKVFNTQWVGDDARVIFRPEGMDPDHSDVMRDLGLNPGDKLSGSLYPKVWARKN